MKSLLSPAFARLVWPAFLVMCFCSCAKREGSVFDPDADRTPPELLVFEVETEDDQAYATWTASEPVRAVVEYGSAPDEHFRHSYSGSHMYTQAGVVALVGAQRRDQEHGPLRPAQPLPGQEARSCFPGRCDIL